MKSIFLLKDFLMLYNFIMKIYLFLAFNHWNSLYFSYILVFNLTSPHYELILSISEWYKIKEMHNTKINLSIDKYKEWMNDAH